MAKVFHVRPIYKDFIWGGSKLIEKYKLNTTLPNVGTIYMVIALPGHLDNIVEEVGEPLSEFYRINPEYFCIEEPTLPIRMTITCNEGLQSYQVHPSDSYALVHEKTKGKISGNIIIEETGTVRKKLFGHKATSLEEFKALIQAEDWDHFFNLLDVPDGSFLNTPAGVVHGGKGDGEIVVTFSTNSDITYRFYDFGRNDPKRPLHLQQVFDCANIPEVQVGAIRVSPIKVEGIEIYKYYDIPGEYTALRLRINGKGSFQMTEFVFYGCYQGEGKIEGVNIVAGETLFIPANSGQIKFEGEMDLVAISYRSRDENAEIS